MVALKESWCLTSFYEKKFMSLYSAFIKPLCGYLLNSFFFSLLLRTLLISAGQASESCCRAVGSLLATFISSMPIYRVYLQSSLSSLSLLFLVSLLSLRSLSSLSLLSLLSLFSFSLISLFSLFCLFFISFLSSLFSPLSLLSSLSCSFFLLNLVTHSLLICLICREMKWWQIFK